MKMYQPFALTLTALLLILSLSGCYTVPITGRTSLNLVSEGDEFQLGMQAYSDAKSQAKISSDPVANERVTRIGKKIAQVSHHPEWDWEFTVFDDPETPNAWCLPGGKVAVYSGLFPYAKTDGELATVMAHEISHAIARHGAERMSQQMVQAAGAAVVAETVANEHIETAKVVYGIGSDLFVMLPYSRKHEYEADRIGLIYMAEAGYNPNEALTFWKRFSEMPKGVNIEFLSTHPADENRIQQIKDYLPEAMAAYTNATMKTSSGQ